MKREWEETYNMFTVIVCDAGIRKDFILSSILDLHLPGDTDY